MCELSRLNTFIGFENSNIDVKELALYGFYFFQKPDIVKCAFCHVTIGNFKNGDTSFDIHLKYSPNCPLLVKRRPTQNIPINSTIFKEMNISSYDECGSYPMYRLAEVRLKTFDTWPKSLKQRPEQLVSAGFFYSGQSDLVVCYSCGLYLFEWETDDDPWEEHKKLTKKECQHLKLKNFIMR